MLLIAHRPELGARADRIVRLDGGRLVEVREEAPSRDDARAVSSRSLRRPRARLALAVLLGAARGRASASA